MGKHNLTLPLLLILVISVMSFPGIIFAEIDVDYCGTGTIPSLENPKVCVAICGDGTSLIDGKCLPTKGFFDLTDNAWIGWGVLLAGVIAGIGIGISIFQQKKESQKRTHEIIQTYSSKLTEITNKEITLKTKQDCALYAEQYLDTLEEISTLALAGNFNQGIINRSYEHITNYFNNNFAYGYDLWWWYHKYIHGFGLVDKDDTDYIQNRLWQVSNKTETHGYKLEDILYKKIVPNPDLMHPKIIWKYDKKDSTELSKEELATIRNTLNYSSKLSNIGFTQDEIKSYIKDGTIKEKRRALLNFLRDDRWPDFRRLCRENNITEFKFDYKGLGGYDASKENWRVLPNLMYYDYEEIPDEDGLSKAEFVEIIRPFANDLSKFIEQEKAMTEPEQFEVYAEQYLETLEQIATLYENKIIPKKASEYFENKFAYGCNLWAWYYDRVLKFKPRFYKSLWNMTSVIKINELVEKGESKYQINIDLFAQFLKDYSGKVEHTSEEIKKIFLEEDPDVLKMVTKINVTDKIIELRTSVGNRRTKKFIEKFVKDGVDEFVKEKTALFSAEKINELLKTFVFSFSNSERWRDFRWWCHDQSIESFEEDPSEGLILPLKMWQAQYL